VVARSLKLSTLRLEYDERGRREVRPSPTPRVSSASSSRPPTWKQFLPVFYDVTGFDRIKYRRPEPLDITERLSRDQAVVVNHILQFEPSWAEVARQMAHFGAESDRSRILRQHGLPDKRDVPAGSGAEPEVWWYYADGVNYWFVGDRLTRTSQFPPMPRPASPQ
jgi:hypothetical protein